MKDNTKKWIWISTGAITIGVGGYFLFKAIRDKFFKSELDKVNEGQNQNSSNGQSPLPNPSVLPNVPFQNTTEGNAFRGWVNDNYPEYAREIDLDRTGSYNNNYIKKAWAKYGSIYTSSKNNPPKPSANDFVILKSVIGAFTKTDNTATKLQIATSSNRPNILIDFYPEGLMIVQKDKDWYSAPYDKLSGSWKISNGNAILTFGLSNYTITPSDNNAVWTMLKDNGYLSWADGSFVPFMNEKSINNDWQKPLL